MIFGNCFIICGGWFEFFSAIYKKRIKATRSDHPSNEEVFNNFKVEYENILKQSGYNNIKLKHQPLVTSSTEQKHHRNIIWFNASFSCNVSTNVKKKFLKVIDKHFPLSKNSLCEIFNRNTITMSYFCLQNLGNIIKLHNKKLINYNNYIILPLYYFSGWFPQ